jgi:UDP-N-acetylglucosamine:LPS N-acetylglucosamine transferase
MTDLTGTVLLVTSSGGVNLELVALRPWWSKYEAHWAAVRAVDTESLVAGHPVRWIDDISTRRPLSLLPALFRAWRHVRAERPGLVVSAGSGPAVPYFIVATALGVPTFWIATLNVAGRPGLSARICGRLASQVIVQRPAQLVGHPDGVLVGELY